MLFAILFGSFYIEGSRTRLTWSRTSERGRSSRIYPCAAPLPGSCRRDLAGKRPWIAGLCHRSGSFTDQWCCPRLPGIRERERRPFSLINMPDSSPTVPFFEDLLRRIKCVFSTISTISTPRLPQTGLIHTKSDFPRDFTYESILKPLQTRRIALAGFISQVWPGSRKHRFKQNFWLHLRQVVLLLSKST